MWLSESESKPGLSVLCCDLGQKGFDGVVESLDGARFAGFQELLELGPCLFDGVQIRRVGRQLENAGPGGLDGFTNTGDLVGGKVIEDHDIPLYQDRCKELADIGEESLAVMGPSSTRGATRPVLRRPAMKVVVRQ